MQRWRRGGRHPGPVRGRLVRGAARDPLAHLGRRAVGRGDRRPFRPRRPHPVVTPHDAARGRPRDPAGRRELPPLPLQPGRRARPGPFLASGDERWVAADGIPERDLAVHRPVPRGHRRGRRAARGGRRVRGVRRRRALQRLAGRAGQHPGPALPRHPRVGHPGPGHLRGRQPARPHRHALGLRRRRRARPRPRARRLPAHPPRRAGQPGRGAPAGGERRAGVVPGPGVVDGARALRPGPCGGRRRAGAPAPRPKRSDR